MPCRLECGSIESTPSLSHETLASSRFDHMLAFIYLAYCMMALLYETVHASEDTWVECLGDLDRYWMAFDDDDIKDRELWTAVAQHWNSEAFDKSPTTGRLYHHLAKIASHSLSLRPPLRRDPVYQSQWHQWFYSSETSCPNPRASSDCHNILMRYCLTCSVYQSTLVWNKFESTGYIQEVWRKRCMLGSLMFKFQDQRIPTSIECVLLSQDRESSCTS